MVPGDPPEANREVGYGFGCMSGRDDQPATVPPPAGEDDAYNAATKVGAMPAEVMAKLRAEGLLPDEDPEELARPSPAAGAPAPSVPRPASTPRVQMPSLRDSVPDMSDPEEDADERTVLSQSGRELAASPYGYGQRLPHGYSQPPPTAYSQPPPTAYSQPPPTAYSQPPAPVETPIAFGSGPGWHQPSAAPPAFPAPHHSYVPSAPISYRESDAGVTQEVRAFGGRRSRTSTLIIVVACVVALVVAAFVMAVLSHRR